MDNDDLRIFLGRYRSVESEIKLLQEERKTLFEDFAKKVKPAILREAVRIVKKRNLLGDDVAQLDALVDMLDGESL